VLMADGARQRAATWPAGRAQPHAVQGGPAQRFAGPIRHVILVSVDGLMPTSYLAPDAHGLKVPTFREMVRRGAYSEGARSVLPTITYPAHTSMATGTNPGTHGIVSNTAWDPLEKNQGGWRWYAEDIRVPTLWDLARAKGLRTALVYWPVTVGARATAIVPEFWRADTPEDVKLLRAVSTPGLLREVEKRFPDFRPGFTPSNAQDEALADIAVHLIETLRPHLLMLHIFQVDHWQHEKGPFSPEASAAVETADRQIARLIEAAKRAGFWNETALVVVSDHGFARTSRRIRPGVLLREKGLVRLDEKNHITDWKAVVLATGGSAYLYVKEEDDRDTRQTLLDAFLPLAGKPGSGIARVFSHEEIVARGGDSGAFLALDAAEGFGVTDGYTGDYISPSTVAATHGYDPARPEMQASLLIYGPAIGAGKITCGADIPDCELPRLIDVAPTVARWLGLELPRSEGAPLRAPMRVGPHSSSAVPRSPRP